MCNGMFAILIVVDDANISKKGNPHRRRAKRR